MDRNTPLGFIRPTFLREYLITELLRPLIVNTIWLTRRLLFLLIITLDYLNSTPIRPPRLLQARANLTDILDLLLYKLCLRGLFYYLFFDFSPSSLLTSLTLYTFQELLQKLSWTLNTAPWFRQPFHIHLHRTYTLDTTPRLPHRAFVKMVLTVLFLIFWSLLYFILTDPSQSPRDLEWALLRWGMVGLNFQYAIYFDKAEGEEGREVVTNKFAGFWGGIVFLGVPTMVWLRHGDAFGEAPHVLVLGGLKRVFVGVFKFVVWFFSQLVGLQDEW